MNRAEAGRVMDRLRALGQNVVSDFAGPHVGYRVIVKVADQDSVKLTQVSEAERLCAGLEAKLKKAST